MFLKYCITAKITHTNSTGTYTESCAEAPSASHPQGVKLWYLDATQGIPVYVTDTYWPQPHLFNLSIGAFLDDFAGFSSAQYLERDPVTGGILSARIFIMQSIMPDKDIPRFIRDTRKVTDACAVPCYPQGSAYDLNEQYLNVEYYLSTNLGYTVIGVLAISSVFLMHPGAVLILVAMIALTLSEVYGYLPFWNLKVNGVSVVNMIMAIGVVVVPIAHITRVFMVSYGDNVTRAKNALAMLVFPMLFSTISTFIGEFPLEFAKFPYFKLYFFYQYVIIGLLTLGNSFIVLSYLLEYFGPPVQKESEHVRKKLSTSGGQEESNLPPLEDSRRDV